MKKEVLVIMEEDRFPGFEDALKECAKMHGGILKTSSLKNDVFYVEEPKTWEDNFREIMNKLGIVKNGCKGYFTLEAIMVAFSENPNKRYRDMYQVYSLAGNNYSNSEKSIRYLIASIWNKNSLEQIGRVLTGNLPITEKPLSNKKFIYLLRDKLFG